MDVFREGVVIEKDVNVDFLIGQEKENVMNMCLSKDEVMVVVRIFICWVGDDFECEGLFDILDWVIWVYEEFFVGYLEEFEDVFGWMFEDVEGYSDMVMLCDIDLEFYCEYYMVLILGKVYVVYVLMNKVVGISKLVCVVEIFVKCLQIQEIMMVQIGEVIEWVLELVGVVILVEVKYQCMMIWGIYKIKVVIIMFYFMGVFKMEEWMECWFFEMIREKQVKKGMSQ